MKIRRDFITNSSSSSFILGFISGNKEDIREEVKKELKKEFPTNIRPGWSCGKNGYFFQLYNEILEEIKEGRVMSLDEVKEEIEDEEPWFREVVSRLREKYAPDRLIGLRYSEIQRLLKTEYGREVEKEEKKDYFRYFLQKVEGKDMFVEVRHGSGGYGEDGILEVKILPHLSCTVAQFGHH